MKRALPVFCLAIMAAAQDPPGTVSGRVLDPTGAAVSGAAVQLDTRNTTTDSEGRFVLLAVAAGAHALSINAPGFVPHQSPIAVRPGAAVARNVTLVIAPIEQRVLVSEKVPATENAAEAWSDNSRAVVDAREIRESGARDAGEALAAIDGLAKIRKGGIANDIVLRGLGRDNINVLVDGARLHGACPNGMDPAEFHVDFAEVQRVEITKGVFDMKNQGSLGGVINIVTKDPEGGLRIAPSLAAGSFGFYNPSLVGSYGTDKVWGLAGYSFRASEPYRDGSGLRFTDYGNYTPAARNSDAFRIHTGWFRLGGEPRPGQRAELSYTRQQSGRALYPYLLMDAGYDNADRLAASWQAARSGIVRQMRVDAYLSRVKHWMTDQLRTSAMGSAAGYSMASFAESATFGGKAEIEAGGVTFGTEVYRRKWDAVSTSRMMMIESSQHIIPAPVADIQSAYAEYQRSFSSRLRVIAGARIDRAATAVQASDAATNLYWQYHRTRSLSTSDVMPSASLWAAYSRGAVEFFAGAGHTARIPDPVERYIAFQRMGSDWVGNPSLRPTRNTEADAGFTLRTKWFLLRPTIFHSSLVDFVTVYSQASLLPAAMSFARSFANVDARSWGGELIYSLAPWRAILVSGGASFIRSTKDAVPLLGIFDRDVAEIPPPRAHATLRYGTRLAFFETTFTAVAAQRRIDRGLLESPTPGHGVLDFKAGLHTKILSLAVGLANALDRFYYEHGSYQRDPFRSGLRVPEPGRNLFVTLQYNFPRNAHDH